MIHFYYLQQITESPRLKSLKQTTRQGGGETPAKEK